MRRLPVQREQFPCTSCGACCRHIGPVAALRGYDRGDGVCKHLSDENLCRIYERRPKICRVREMKPRGLAWRAWVEANLRACRILERWR